MDKSTDIFSFQWNHTNIQSLYLVILSRLTSSCRYSRWLAWNSHWSIDSHKESIKTVWRRRLRIWRNDEILLFSWMQLFLQIIITYWSEERKCYSSSVWFLQRIQGIKRSESFWIEKRNSRIKNRSFRIEKRNLHWSFNFWYLHRKWETTRASKSRHQTKTVKKEKERSVLSR